MVAIVLLVLYGMALTFIFFYSLIQLHLVYCYLKSPSAASDEARQTSNITDWPMVTIQLPIFNERYVVERLIDAVAQFNYPRKKLEIQVLDDSTDETVDIVDNKVQKWQNQGINIYQVHRTDRKGYKAGALQYGFQQAQGEFLAIFDADFIPEPDFLKKTLPPLLEEEDLGVVQTCWDHINKDYSMLTQLQAFGLDAHFSVEQKGRNAGGFFINFNGTAGVWRRQCIEEAGGWHTDTLTEDLDLSYRAQLEGWSFKFLEGVHSPAELPVSMEALKSQQYRWTKGAAETARKNLMRILKAPVSVSKKLHATFHLLNSAIFICVLLCGALSVPLLWIKNSAEFYNIFFRFASFFLLSLLILGGFYWVSLFKKYPHWGKRMRQFVVKFPLFLSMSMGISFHNAIAVIEGYLGFKTPFVRTPKFNVKRNSDRWQNNKYVSTKVSMLTIIEGLMALYFVGGMGLGVYLNDFGLFVFHFMLALGFGIIFWYSIKHTLFLTNAR